jgi:hypothetical protein
MTPEAELAKVQQEVLLLRQDLRDLYEALGLYDGANSTSPHDFVDAAVQLASAIRSQNTHLKTALETRVESTLATL